MTRVLHSPEWVEDNLRTTSRHVIFICQVCGKSAAVANDGKSMPPMSPH